MKYNLTIDAKRAAIAGFRYRTIALAETRWCETNVFYKFLNWIEV